ETLTIRPASLFRSNGNTAWVRRQAPNRFVSIVWWASSSGAFAALVATSPMTARVVDEDVEAAEAGEEPLGEVRDAAGVGDVELSRLQREPPPVGELGGRPLSGSGIARGDDHVVTELGELPGHLAPNAP